MVTRLGQARQQLSKAEVALQQYSQCDLPYRDPPRFLSDVEDARLQVALLEAESTGRQITVTT